MPLLWPTLLVQRHDLRMDQKLHDGIFNILGNTCFLWHNTPNTLFKSWIKLVIADIDGVDIGIVVQASQGRLRFLDDRAGIQGLALADGPSLL